MLFGITGRNAADLDFPLVNRRLADAVLAEIASRFMTARNPADVATPASCSRRIEMLCSCVNRDFFLAVRPS